MDIDPAKHSKSDNYKLLTNLVVPRPIAWVSTCNATGLVNLAPFSFFNAVASDPLYIVLSVGDGRGGQPKDTARNILASSEFVVNLVTEDVVDAMNLSAAGFPADESEFAAADLPMASSLRVTPPRVGSAQASLECRLHSHQRLGDATLFIGQVVMFHVADHLMGPRMHVNGFAPVGRMGSPAVYCRTHDRFDLPGLSYAEWQARALATS